MPKRHDEGWRAGNALPVRLGDICVDHRVMTLAGKAFAEGVRVETDILCILRQVFVLQLTIVFKQAVVHGPKLAMLTEIYVEALLVDEELADQVWEAWDAGGVYDEHSCTAWRH